MSRYSFLALTEMIDWRKIHLLSVFLVESTVQPALCGWDLYGCCVYLEPSNYSLTAKLLKLRVERVRNVLIWGWRSLKACLRKLGRMEDSEKKVACIE